MASSPWRDLVLYRAKGPRSLWKRASEFPLGRAVIGELNGRLPGRGETALQAAWDTVVQQVKADSGVIVSRVAFTPLRMLDGKSVLRVLVGDELLPLSDLSFLIDSLNDAWQRELQVFAFTDGTNTDPGLSQTVAQRLLDALPQR
jgi:hypothetical protein